MPSRAPTRPALTLHCTLRLLLPILLLTSAGAICLFWLAKGNSRSAARRTLVVDLRGCKGFAELRQSVGLALVASRLSQRCLILSGLTTWGTATTTTQSLANSTFNESLLGGCIQRIQGCYLEASDQVQPGGVPVIGSFHQLMKSQVKRVSWKCSSVSLPLSPNEQESSFWKAISCLDTSKSAPLEHAAKIARAALNDRFHLILGAASITQQGKAKSQQNCKGVHCEYHVGRDNLAEHLTHKGLLPSTQLVIADNVDVAAEGMLTSLADSCCCLAFSTALRSAAQRASWLWRPTSNKLTREGKCRATGCPPEALWIQRCTVA